MPRIKFSIRTLLLLTCLFALLAFGWTNPPRNAVRIEVDNAGQISVDGETVDTVTLKSKLNSRRRWLSIWHSEPHVDVLMEEEWLKTVDPQVSFLPLAKTIKAAGFADPTFIIVDKGQVQ